MEMLVGVSIECGDSYQAMSWAPKWPPPTCCEGGFVRAVESITTQLATTTGPVRLKQVVNFWFEKNAQREALLWHGRKAAVPSLDLTSRVSGT